MSGAVFDRPFPTAEYHDRVEAVRRAMAAHGLDGLLLTGGPNLTYLTGYPAPARAGARPFLFLLPLTGDPTLIVQEGRRFEARGYSWVDDLRTYAALSQAPLPELLAAIDDAGLATARIGAEIGPEQVMDLPVAGFDELRRRRPRAAFVDAGPVLSGARMRKSAAEIARLREACRLTGLAYERTFGKAGAGMTEADLARAMNVATLELGGSSPWVILTSGAGNYDYASKLPSRRRLEPGDLVWLDCGCAVGGYWSDFSRAAVVGAPQPGQQRAQARLHEITMHGVELVRPGATTAAIARACNAALAELDFPITSSISGLAGRIGHGIGLATTEPPHVAETDETTLEPGMVITIEPGVATADGTFHVEEIVLVTETGCELLTSTARDLFVIASHW